MANLRSVKLGFDLAVVGYCLLSTYQYQDNVLLRGAFSLSALALIATRVVPGATDRFDRMYPVSWQRSFMRERRSDQRADTWTKVMVESVRLISGFAMTVMLGEKIKLKVAIANAPSDELRSKLVNADIDITMSFISLMLGLVVYSTASSFVQGHEQNDAEPQAHARANRG